jgi:hypothetical protein
MAVYALEVSPPLFQLATDSLRRHSNARSSLCSFDDLIEACISRWSKMDAIDVAAVRDHLRTMPTDGELTLRLAIKSGECCPLSRVRDALQTALNCQLSLAETVSALLFLFVVEREAQRVLEKVRLQPHACCADKTDPAKILPFR